MSSDDELRTEGNKLLHETMKQLITLSTGSILFTIALEEKIRAAPRWKFLVAIAVVSFLVSIFASMTMMWAISLNVGAGYSRNTQPIELPARRLAMWSFGLAIIATVIFAIRNLWI